MPLRETNALIVILQASGRLLQTLSSSKRENNAGGESSMPSETVQSLNEMARSKLAKIVQSRSVKDQLNNEGKHAELIAAKELLQRNQF